MNNQVLRLQMVSIFKLILDHILACIADNVVLILDSDLKKQEEKEHKSRTENIVRYRTKLLTLDSSFIINKVLSLLERRLGRDDFI